MARFSEDARQIVHVAMSGFALLLRALSVWQAAALALVALLLNLFVLPRLAGDRLFRAGEGRGGRPGGIALYPLAVLVLILTFPTRPDVAAGAWGVLAWGDGFATLIGRRLGHLPKWPWHPDKSVAGSTAFFVAAWAASAFLVWWTSPAIATPPSWWFIVGATALASLAAALVETIPIRLDDNLSVAFSAAAVLWVCTLVSSEAIEAAWPAVASRLPVALGLNLVVAWISFRGKTVSTSGMLAGLVIGVAVYLGAGAGGWLLLFAAFATAALTSRVGLRRKMVLGIDEARRGQRGAGNALANCLVAAVASIVAIASPHHAAALAAVAAALVAGASDTAASELGKAWGRRTILMSTFSRVPPGTPGAVSLEGTAVGLVAALLLALLASALGLIGLNLVWVVVVAATIGAFVESALGATLEKPGVVNNDVLNFLNTAVAAFVALAIARSLP